MTIDTFDENDPSLTDRGDDFVPTPDDEETPATPETPPAEPAGDDQGEPETKANDKPRMVPHARFNEVNDEYKAERERRLQLEEELARLRGEKGAAEQPPAQEAPKEPEAPAFDFDAREDAYHEAIFEGDTAKAKQIRAEIRAAERAEAERMAQDKVKAERQAWEQEQTAAEQQRTAKQAQEAYATTLATVFELHPQLDDQHESFNKETMEDVREWLQFYIAKGTDAASALSKAVARVIPDKPAVQVPATGKADQVKRNLQADSQQPPEMLGVGERAKRTDYTKLSEAEFNKLSDEDKRRARGDFV